jgi:hypothetical protein
MTETDDWAVFDALDGIDLHPHQRALAWLVATYGRNGMQLSAYKASACLGLTRKQYYTARRGLYDRGLLTILPVEPDPKPTAPITLLHVGALLAYQGHRPMPKVSLR